MNAIATNGDTPLHVAMKLSDENRCLVLTELLVGAGCNPCELDADDKPPIQVAVMRGFVSVVEHLISRDVRLPSRILFAALQAPVVKRVEMIRLLIAKGANVHALNPNGDTLLHANMRSPDRSVCLEIAKRLVDVGCNPLARDIRGETPLHIAAKRWHHEVVNYLISFSSSSDVLSLLQDRATQASTLCVLICSTHGLSFPPEEQNNVLRVVQQFTNNEDKCLELAKTFTGDAGSLFARRFGSARLLDIAVRRGFSKVVEFICSQAVPFPTALLFTALRYRVSMVPSLVCKGADVHVRDENDSTLLHVAVSILEETQCCETTRVLVEAGCDPFAFNNANEQPIHIAVSQGFLAVVELLLYYFNPTASLPPDLLFTALHSPKRYSMVQLLVNHGANVSYIAPNGDHLLHVLLRSAGEEDECLEIIPMLILETQCCGTTRVLAEAGCDPFAFNNANEQPIHIAVSQGFLAVVELLLYYYNPTASLPPDLLFTALHSPKRYSMVRLLVNHGANVSYTSPNGDHLLHILLSSTEEDDCVEITKIFCEAGCSLLAPNARGETPLHIAVSRGSISVVDYLLLRNVPFPSDILFFALRSRFSPIFAFEEMIASLVHKGADIHARDPDQNTVLHGAMWIAPENLCLEVTKLFIAAGCDPHACDAMGSTPLELATNKGYSEVAEYLRRSSSESEPLLKPPVPPLARRLRRVEGRLLSSARQTEPDDLGLGYSL